MAVTPIKIWTGTMGNTDYTIYTPTTKVILKSIVLCNITTEMQTASLSINSVNILKDTKIEPNSTVVMDVTIVMNARDAVNVKASKGAAVSVTLSGVEVS